jgi:hypothetical protein
LIGKGVVVGFVFLSDSPVSDSGVEGGEFGGRGLGKVNLSDPIGTCIMNNAQDKMLEKA